MKNPLLYYHKLKQKAQRGYNSLTRLHRVSAYQQDETAKILTAFDDLRDRTTLPPCPVCGGKLRWVGKEFGGGVRCSIDIDKGCSYHAAVMIKYDKNGKRIELLELPK